jgi:hypothetical protein
MTEFMTRILTILVVLAGLVWAATASAASVASSGNFHVAAGKVGCHFVVYGPVSAGLGSSATIRCERYSDHTFMSISAAGKITESHSGTKVAPGATGHSGKWFHRYTTKVSCETDIGIGNEPAVYCSYNSKSFVLGPGGAMIYR